MNRQFLLLRVHWETRRAERELNKALADDIVPELRKLIEKHARKIAKKYEPESLLAADAASDLLLTTLIGFLTLSEVDEPELDIQRYQMTPEIVRWWLTPPGE